MQLTEQCLSVLVDILNASKSLCDLDLSWNELRPQNLKALLVALSSNRTLSYLNLSWNNLGNTITSEEETWSDFVVSHLSKFVKYNRNLLHLDLSSTRLTDKEIKELGSSLRRAKSLVSIHFSGNPGVSMGVREFLFEKLRCRPSKEDLDPSMSQLIRKAMSVSPQREG